MLTILKIGIVALAAFLGYASHYVGPFKNKPDNIVEELSEDFIKRETNIDVDLSPDSKEG